MKMKSSLGVLVGVVVLSSCAAGCGSHPTQPAAGAPTTSYAPWGRRAVLNQPIGPVPGVGDIEPVANPFGNDRTALEEGRKLFVQFNCAGCHGGRAGGGMGPSLRDQDWMYGNSDAQIFSSIVEGRAHGMPSWQSQLTADQIWKLVTYIKSLRTRNEPQAPPTL